MFEIKVSAEFEAAHRVAGYPGKCDRLHGHSWVVEASVIGSKLDNLGMLVDFKLVKGRLRELLETLDHRMLNELPAFENINPTAENIAQYVYNEMKKAEFFNDNAKLKYIQVWESPKSSVIYTED
ncbi:MAG: 6-carboxytetrahydropterin synthase QueD [Selenomonadales bacterium]|jgi:6-pyruvoyltetrahydropterin/6-carboxytetrahydropterin synthase|nr:6-carboxytetrahydropterin synthase QueD [Selenomonadales bacterium]MDY3739469.1 6-carboxytetrahydropterin synthase QueD [Selenomonadaceae bacterium]MEE1361571.1 6-carboxytetrahydropterin synthase QueD [Selenomonadaceae bacterium]